MWYEGLELLHAMSVYSQTMGAMFFSPILLLTSSMEKFRITTEDYREI